jgi:hypothetical protein
MPDKKAEAQQTLLDFYWRRAQKHSRKQSNISVGWIASRKIALTCSASASPSQLREIATFWEYLASKSSALTLLFVKH